MTSTMVDSVNLTVSALNKREDKGDGGQKIRKGRIQMIRNVMLTVPAMPLVSDTYLTKMQKKIINLQKYENIKARNRFVKISKI